MKGVTVTLIDKVDSGTTDSFNRTIYIERTIYVNDVLVAPTNSTEIVDSINLYGKKASYTLGIPKGDTNTWEDREVVLPAPFAGRYKVIGFPTAGIDALIPLRWNKKVYLERYG